MKRPGPLAGAAALLAVACGGLLYNQGNGFPCDFNAAEDVRDKACAPGEVCGVLGRCERFVYEGPQFEGPPNLPAFTGGKRVHPLLLDGPVQALTFNARREEAVLLSMRVADGGRRGFNVINGPLTLVSETVGDVSQLREVALASADFGAALFQNGSVRLIDGGLVQLLPPTRALRVGADAVALLTGPLLPNAPTLGVMSLGKPLLDLEPVGADGGAQRVIDMRWLPESFPRKPIMLTREGFFVPVFDGGLADGGIEYLALTPDEDPSTIAIVHNEPRPQLLSLRHDPTGTLWAFSRLKRTPVPTVLSTWLLSRRGEAPKSMVRAWNDCSPCGFNGRIFSIAPNFDGVGNVEVLCGANVLEVPTLSLVRVVGAAGADPEQPCVTQPVAPAFELNRLSSIESDAGVNRQLVVDEVTGAGVLAGGTRGEIWRGPSFSRALPLFLERVPLAIGTVAGAGGVPMPLALTDKYLAAPVGATEPFYNGLKVFDVRRAADVQLDDDVRARALVGASGGWVVLSSGDLARVALRADLDAGTAPFKLSFGPRLVSARGEPAREPFLGEAVSRPDGTVVSLVLTADDSVYLAPAPSESSAPNAQAPLFPQLTPEPGSPIRSFALERTPIGTDGVKRVRGYAVTSRNLFIVTLAGEPARWSASPVLLGGGEPLEVWMDNPRGGLARVAYRDGTVFSLPGGFLLARPGAASGGEPSQVSDYENLGGWPVAYASTGLWEAHYDVLPSGKLDNKLPDGRPGKPMEWRQVTMANGARPWMQPSDAGLIARPGRLHVLASPQQLDGGVYQQQFRLFLYLDDAVYEVGSMLRTNASPPPK